MTAVQVSVDSAARPIDGDPLRVSFPSVRTLVSQAVPRLLEGVIVPLAVFYAALTLFGLNGALAAVLAWVYGNAAVRLLWHRSLSGTMVLAMLAITARSALALWSGSAIVYFLQPELGTVCVSVAFLVSVRMRRPLVGKLILDYVRLPASVVRQERVQRCFARLTVVWALVLLVNTSVGVWLLLGQPIEVYLLVRPLAVAGITTLTFIGSVWGFLRTLRHFRGEPSPCGGPRSAGVGGAPPWPPPDR